jgi:hypothetical protein
LAVSLPNAYLTLHGCELGAEHNRATAAWGRHKGATMLARVIEPELVTTRTAKAWYAEHRVDVLARLTDGSPGAALARRSAELLALALDDDPAIVGRALKLS